MGLFDTLLRLIIAHLLADFVFQTDEINKKKKEGVKSRAFWTHILIVGATTYVILGEWSNWLLPITIMISHGVIDLVKIRLTQKRDTVWHYLGDQVLHLISLVVIWLLFYKVNLGEFQSFFAQLSSTKSLLLITSFLVITWPVGYLIGYMTKSWQKQLEGGNSSLSNAGKTIGIIERCLILIFILKNQWEAIGFLLAAKSVFRFGDLNDHKSRQYTEYVLIGTLLSFTFSIVIGILTLHLFGMF